MRKKSCTVILMMMISFIVFAQKSRLSEADLLNSQPNFLKTKLKAADALFQEDVATLKKFHSFDSVDVEILKPQLLYAILSETKVASPVTYQTVLNAIQQFKQGIGYIEFRKGIILYREMENLTVNPQQWEKDQQLFKKLGFTEADLEDFLLFISRPEHKALSYKQAYLAYMKEIDSL